MAGLFPTRRLLPVLAVCWLGLMVACSPLDRLKRAQEHDSGTFASNLAAEYLAFAESEAELKHTDNSRYFARKGLKAAQGQPPLPESPADWTMDPATRMELRNARNRLMQVRSEFFTRVASHSVARAQMLYDCWVMQAAEHTDNDLTLPCRGEFINELGQLEQIIDTLGATPKVTLPAHYTILFALGSAELDKDADFTIQEVLAISRLYPDHTIEVTGHADRSGSAQRNRDLSWKRAQRVTRALIAAGLDAERIGFSADGEDNPAIPTLDGVARERNRRVEISVLPLQTHPVASTQVKTQDTPQHSAVAAELPEKN